MNLYEFSMANNKEMGVLIDKNDLADSELFAEAMKDVDLCRLGVLLDERAGTLVGGTCRAQ
jgi:hypothetical protein